MSAANGIAIRKTTINIDAVHDNTSQELISITSDKLKLILIDHLKYIENRKNWLHPFGIFLTVVLVFCSADFKSALGLPAETWQAIFVIVGFAAFIWLCYSIKFLTNNKQSIDDVILIIKNRDQ